MTFKEGDWVLLSTKNLPPMDSNLPKKLQPRFIGPFQVAGVRGQTSYALNLPERLSSLHPVFHVSLLRPAPQAPAINIPSL